jgi:hypothetical protein
VSLESMDYKEAQDIQTTLRMDEKSIQCNKTFLFLMTSKVHENKNQCTSQNATIITKTKNRCLKVIKILNIFFK